jgi:murein DD-endopeptidase MepM/ murein hydrolase activator NlpD
VMIQSLNVRSGPGTEHGIITAVGQGTVLDVLAIQNGWVQVRVGTTTGFVTAQYVDLNTNKSLTGGFLIERADLLETPLAPSRVIPAQPARSAESVVANTWNAYGGLLERLGGMLNIPVDGIVAAITAESGGNAFGPDGRMIIRFENHIFWRYWGEKNPDMFNRHFQMDTSSPKNSWKGHKFRLNPESPWGDFHGSQKAEWDVFNFARGLDETAAMSSISMGAPQIMGFNFKRLGYESVQRMFEYFARSAHAQILAMFDFVKGPNSSSPAITALQTRDYLTFASIYNGPGNAQTYQDIIQRYSDAFNRIISSATPVQRAPDLRGPADLPPPAPEPTENVQVLIVPFGSDAAAVQVNAPANPGTNTTVTVSPTITPQTTQGTNQGAPEPAPTTTVTVNTAPPAVPAAAVVSAPPPPQNAAPVVMAAVEGLNVRNAPGATGNDTILEKLKLGEPVTLLEPLEQALSKMAQPEASKQFINVRTDENRVGWVAAWLVAPSEGLVKNTVDEYINSIPDRYEIPDGYRLFWSMQEQLGLPDPFPSLPVQIRSRHKLVNMMVNGFGPNTFSSLYWKDWYSRVGGMHNGYDFIIETGTPLLAVSDGVVITDWLFMGNPAEKTVALWCFLPERFKDSKGRRMMSNVIVAYGHMSNNSMRKRFEVVKAGDVIGLSGTPAGQNDNDHLHYEVHFLSGDTQLRNPSTRKLLGAFNRPQPFDNRTPWNPLLFYSERLVKYQLHQAHTIGFGGRPAYPTPDQLNAMGAGHLGTVDSFTLAYYQYGIPVIWQNSGRQFPEGCYTIAMLPDRLKAFSKFEPYEASFLG